MITRKDLFSKHPSQQILAEGIKHGESAANEWERRIKTIQYYDSIGSMKREQKIEALKNENVNPYLLHDDYDGLTNSLHRWKNIASQSLGRDDKTKNTISSNYYDSMLRPFYEHMGAEPISKELWMKHAYGEALKWDINKAYDSHWRQGLYKGFKGYENILDYALTAIPSQKGSLVDHIQHNLHKQFTQASSTDGFWADINPSTKWYQKLGSFVEEQVMNLPLYEALGGYNRSLLASLTGTGGNLSKALITSKAGKVAASLLTNGAEGLAYGLTMRDEGDKHNSWQDALGNAIIGTVFHVGGEHFGKLRGTKLEAKLNLAKQNLKEATPEEIENALKKSIAGNLAAGGRPYQDQVWESAFEHVRYTEGLSTDAIRNGIKGNLERDPARYKPIYECASFIRSLLEERKLSSFSKEDLETIHGRIANLTNQAAKEAPALVKEMQEESVQSHYEASKKESNQSTIKEIAEDLKKSAIEDGRPPRSDEQYLEMARRKFAIQNAKGEAIATKETSKNDIEQALDAAEIRKNIEPTLKSRSTYRFNKKGEPAVSFSLTPEQKVYFKKAAGSLSSKDMKQWLDGMEQEDFNKMLYDNFFPKDLKDNKIYFEHENTKEGRQNPNLLGFMYNYMERMPKEIADKLSEHLEDTLKFEKAFDPSKDIEMQKRYFAQGMRNHVQDFVESGRYKQESPEGLKGNIFRTTYADLKNPTSWQTQLHREVGEAEEGMLKKMFKNPDNRKAALGVFRMLNKERLKAFSSGDQEAREEFNERIAEYLIEKSGNKLIRWDF